MKKSRIFEVFENKKRIYTVNLTPGKTVYGEKTLKENGKEYREWDFKRSKLAAMIMKGCKNIFIRKGDTILYLGAASGTTVSHISDMIGSDGFIFAVEFSPKILRDLVYVAEERKNIAPILGDASQPTSYTDRTSAVDIVYQDVAQRNQAEIFIKNCELYLKKGGYGLLAVKARSVDIGKKPRKIFRETREFLERRMTVIDYKELDPYEKDHAMFICKKKA